MMTTWKAQRLPLRWRRVRVMALKYGLSFQPPHLASPTLIEATPPLRTAAVAALTGLVAAVAPAAAVVVPGPSLHFLSRVVR